MPAVRLLRWRSENTTQVLTSAQMSASVSKPCKRDKTRRDPISTHTHTMDGHNIGQTGRQHKRLVLQAPDAQLRQHNKQLACYGAAYSRLLLAPVRR